MVDPIFNTKDGSDRKGNGRPSGDCSICTALGIPNINHNTANCFANYRDNPHFRPRTFALRLEAA